jgi:hypothetical protein
MAIRAIIHIPGEESILCDMEAMPKPSDTFIIVYNPRRKDGKPLQLIDESVTCLVYPFTRISYIELFEERSQRETVVGFFRESDGRRRLP